MSDDKVMEYKNSQTTTTSIPSVLGIAALEEQAGQFSPALRESSLRLTASSRVEHEAIDWLIRMESADSFEAYWIDFHTWLERQPEHKETYISIERKWHHASAGVSSSVRMQNDMDYKNIVLMASAATDTRRRLVRWATPLMLFIVAAGAVYELVAPPMGEAEVETSFGQQRTIVLADHSVVTLNTDSRLRARLTWSKRELILERGEALFHVQKETRKRPFVVIAKDAAVEATGTEFAVRIKSDSERISVSEGQVKIASKAPSSARPSSERVSQYAVANAGDVADVSLQGAIHVASVGLAAVRRGTLWKQDQIALTHATLREWVAEFNRYKPGALVIQDPLIDNITLTGSFSTTDPDTFADELSAAYGVQHNSDSETGTIYLRGRK